MYTANIPEPIGITLGTFSDDTAYLTTDIDPIAAANRLQRVLNELEKWTDTWRIKINPNKSESAYVVLTLNKWVPPSVKFKRETIPESDSANYFGMHID